MSNINYIEIDLAERGENDFFQGLLQTWHYKVIGTSADNFIRLASGNDLVYGIGGNNTIAGGRDDDILYGGTGNDTIFGNHGNDVLDGGGGRNILSGGPGNDIYRVSRSSAGGTIINDGGTLSSPLEWVDGGGFDTLIIYEEPYSLDLIDKPENQTHVPVLRDELREGFVGSQREGTTLWIDLNQDGEINANDDLQILFFYNSDGFAGPGYIEDINWLELSNTLIVNTNGDESNIDKIDRGILSDSISNDGSTLDPGKTRYYKFERTTPEGVEGFFRFDDSKPFRLKTELTGNVNVELLDHQKNKLKGIPTGELLHYINGSDPDNPETGVYYFKVTNSSDETVNYTLTSNLIQINGIVIDGDTEKIVNIHSFNDAPIDAKKETWILSHGWKSNPGDAFSTLAPFVGGGKQTLKVDWQQPAYTTGGLDVKDAAVWIDDVAAFVTSSLRDVWEIDRNNLNLIGHSLGSYLSSRIAQNMGGVERLIALDPARSVWGDRDFNITNNNEDEITPFAFQDVSKFSRAFWGQLSYGNGAGNETNAGRAHESFEVKFPYEGLGDHILMSASTKNHSNIITLYANLISNDDSNINTLFRLDDSSRIISVKDFDIIENGFGQDEGQIYSEYGGTSATKLYFKIDKNPYPFINTSTLRIKPDEIAIRNALFYKVVDGYILDGTMFLDVNGNRQLDEDEAFTIISGNELPFLSFNEEQLTALENTAFTPTLVFIGDANTKDTATGLNFQTSLTAPSQASVITPLTTLLVKLEKQGLSPAEAETLVKNIFGVDANVSLIDFDPIAEATLSNPSATSVFGGGASVQNTVTQVANFLRGASPDLSLHQLSLSIFDSMANLIKTGDFSLNNPTTIINLINNSADQAGVNLTAEQKGILSDVVAVIVEGQTEMDNLDASNPQNYLQEVTKIQQVFQGQVSQSLETVAQNPNTINVLVDNYTGENLQDKLNEAQPLNIFPPTSEDLLITISGSLDQEQINVTNGTVVGKIVASDSDGNPLTFSYDLGEDALLQIYDFNGDGVKPFSLDTQTGEIVITDVDDLKHGFFNYGLVDTFMFDVRVSDGDFFSNSMVTINLGNDSESDEINEPVAINIPATEQLLTFSKDNVQILYIPLTGRPADSDGLEFWRNAIAENNISYSPSTGDTLMNFPESQRLGYETIINDFASSSEIVRLFGEKNDDLFAINLVYENAFNRSAEEEGLNYWGNALEVGDVTFANLALEIALGARGSDVTILKNKVASAELFTQQLNSLGMDSRYVGEEAEKIGFDFLSSVGNTPATLNQINNVINSLPV